MYNKTLGKLVVALNKTALEAKKIAEDISPIINELSKKEKRTELEDKQLDNIEYAYSYLKDSLEGVSRIKVAVKHADVFYNEYNNDNK